MGDGNFGRISGGIPGKPALPIDGTGTKLRIGSMAEADQWDEVPAARPVRIRR